MRRLSRGAAVLALVVTWTALALVRPSWSCGCGAMVTSGTEKVLVGQETSIVRYDDATRTEQIVMRLGVRSKAANAAWLFPTPAAATVELGDRSWFRELDRLTEPVVVKRREWWHGKGGGGDATGAAPGAGSRAGSVAVLGEKRIGPFQVATLASEDPKALAGWLSGHGYALSPRLAGGLAPYVAMKWKYVAIKLDPGAGQVLNGELDPLRITFASDSIVYPMRLSRLATTDQNVHLYVLGGHRVVKKGPYGDREGTTFAGWVSPGEVTSPGLRSFLGGRVFMTEVVAAGLEPARITGDFGFSYSGDRTYRETIHETEYVSLLGMPAGWALVLLGSAGAAVLVFAGFRVSAAARRRSAGRSSGAAAAGR